MIEMELVMWQKRRTFCHWIYAAQCYKEVGTVDCLLNKYMYESMFEVPSAGEEMAIRM